MAPPVLGPRRSIEGSFEAVEGYPESKSFVKKYWNVVADYDGSISPVPKHISSLEFLADIPNKKITRGDVRAKFSFPIDQKAIFWTIVWGYERGRIGNNPDNMIRALVNAQEMANEVNHITDTIAREGPLPSQQIIERLNNAGKVGTSTSSKVAAMARIQSLEGECVILDRQVIASIFYHRFADFKELERIMMPRTIDGRACLGERIDKSFNRREDFYADYVRRLSELASTLGSEPEQIERFLFRSVPDMEPINRRWKHIKEKRERAATRQLT
ncbi:8-oxoguanine DNA glycosylase OGG fold protein [Novosphingobium beihaiensis]|uniref:Uncharacterized protein n=1 Tax=Novosphingobium beihaiensis TaxID=2930389 RepID=A0ABT0BVR6_9SPHN|nr:hypothetical protein [Novosphingobium beihaiensis]MCJ2189023.1 hypothetical protein [Novosphingobium beihaiensis]